MPIHPLNFLSKVRIGLLIFFIECQGSINVQQVGLAFPIKEIQGPNEEKSFC